MKTFIKFILNLFPSEISNKLKHHIKLIVDRKYRWSRNTYWMFGQENRKRVFLSAARFMNINRPIKGYYFEFGCNEANTFRMAYNTFKNLFDLKYVAFDSFEGLPKVEGIDKMEVFHEGKLKFDKNKFVELVKKEGIKDEEFIVVKGFYEESLNQKLIEELSPTKAAVIYIDCDLYTSTVSVLEFIKHFLQPGTIIIFDDWNCFFVYENRGQKKAFSEFLNSNKNFVFEDFISDAESKSFIYINNKNES